ncbi:MAG: hypothetical protein ACXWQ5_08970 [Ktedonobacterales bacterium]
MLPRLGLAAGAVGWKAGHEAVRSGALILDEQGETVRNERLAAYRGGAGACLYGADGDRSWTHSR